MDTYSRAVAYLEKLDPAVSGARGHDHTLRAACELFRFGLSSSDALEAMRQYNARCQPPWKEHELKHKVADAEKIVRGSGKFGMRGGPRIHRSRAFVAPPAPVRKARPLPPVASRREADEEAYWGRVATSLGLSLLEFDRKCGVYQDENN